MFKYNDIHVYISISYHMELKSFKNEKHRRMMNMMPLKSYLPFTHVRFGGSSWCNQDHLLSYGSILKLGHLALASSRNSPSAVGNPWCVPLPSSRFLPKLTQFDHVSHHIMISSTCAHMSKSKVHPAGCLSLDNSHLGLSENRLNPEKPNGFADHYPY